MASSASISPGESAANAEAQRSLGLQVAREFLGVASDPALIKIGPLTQNYFSFTFSVEAESASGPRSVFVKIPKTDMRGRVAAILPVTSDDRRLAEEEASSLTLLGQKWSGADLAVRWVNLRGMVPEYNAIVTDRIYAAEALPVFRRFDLCRRTGVQGAGRRLDRSMARMGAALGRFHAANARTKVFRLSEALPKLEFYCRELSACSGSRLPMRVIRELKSMRDLEFGGVEAPSLKGLDVRNMLIDEKDSLYLLDPGKTKRTFREADIARFIMTLRILYWGSARLLLLREPDPRAEEAFLGAYYADSKPASPFLLRFFILKEYLKHWHTALDSLQRRAWPPTIKRLAVGLYVNPFYARQIAAQLKSIIEEV